MEKTREYFRSMISQRGITQTFFQGDEKYNAAWDYAVSPEGRHFIGICAEGPKIDAMLYEYLPETREMIECVDTKKHIITYPRTIRPSKIHTCINFMEDGRVIMNNHTTAGAPSHPGWMTEAYFSHPWEGFPGSNVFIYDPKTGKTEDMGIPVPHESIYGGSYDPTHRAYYFSGYFRGHGYRLDLDTRRVTDYGQFTEFGVYLHHKGPDGNVYLTTRTGVLLRYNVETQAAEFLGHSIPMNPDYELGSARNSMSYAANGPDGRIYFGCHRSEDFWAYNIEKDELEDLGCPVPSWYYEKYRNLYMVFGMGFDSQGTLWYGLKILGQCMRLVSWDVLHGGSPVDHGVVGTVEHAAWNFSEIAVVDDILYGATTNHESDGPAVLAIDLRIMREDVDKPREMGRDPIIYRGTEDADLYPGEEKLTGPAAADATTSKATVRVRGGTPFADGILRARPAGNHYVDTNERYVTKLWKQIGVDESPVHSISHDENGNVIAISGSEKTGYFRNIVKNGKLISSEKTEYTPCDTSWLEEKYKDVILPVPAGRAWLMDATCEAELADGSFLVGNKAGGLAVVKDGKSFQLGLVTSTGPIRALSASPDRRTVYGVAGDPDEIGFVFSYSMDFGVVNHGMLYFESASSEEGMGCSSEPCCIDYAPDGKSIAIGVRDRLGCVYEYVFNQP